MDEGRLSQELTRAAQAQRLLDDELLREAFAAVKARYEQEWMASRLDDQQKRERCFLAMRALNDVVKAIETHIETGKLAKAEVRARNKVN